MRYHAASFSYACISTMHCPFCGAHDTKVIDSRLVAEGDQVRRRRECLACGERFTTFETAELVMPRLIKQDGSRQPFDEDKLRAGMQRALRSVRSASSAWKRPSATSSTSCAPPASARSSRGCWANW